MTGEQILKRFLSYMLPLTAWRVPVSLCRGQARSSGRPVTLLTAGHDRVTGYIAQHLFDGDPVIEPVARVALWKLPKLLDRLQPSVDLTVVGIDRLSAQLVFDKSYLTSPAWIASWMPVPKDIRDLVRASSRLEGDLRVVRKHKFERLLSRSEADFDIFYDRFYAPYISKRHGSLTHLRPRWSLRRQFRLGQILWVCRNGEIQAGDIIQVKNRTLHRIALGVADGRLDLLQERALAAIYVHTTQYAQEVGCSAIFLGASRPSLHDGVFCYKRKWGAVVCEHPEVNYKMLLRWTHLEGPVTDFLSHTSIIHHDQDELSALWAYHQNTPLTAERLQTEIRAIKTPGLRRLRILLPDEPPPEFVCPPDVELINLRTLSETGPEFLRAGG